MIPRLAIPSRWSDHLTDEGAISLGYDVATTENKTSNPSSISVQQRSGRIVHTRLLVAWKSREPLVATQIISAILDDIEARRLKPRRLVIDNSSEKYYATQTRQQFAGRCAVELVAGNEKLEFRGEKLDSKTLLGNMYVSAIEDGFLTLPAGEWIEVDHRLVMREAGGFTTLLGPHGEHGDTFDAGKLAYWGLTNASGPVRADAIQVGGFGPPSDTKRPIYNDPWMDGIVRQNLEPDSHYLA